MPPDELEDADFEDLLAKEASKAAQSAPPITTLVPPSQRLDWKTAGVIGISFLVILLTGIFAFVILHPPGNGIPSTPTSP
jgi:hypothetical protein